VRNASIWRDLQVPIRRAAGFRSQERERSLTRYSKPGRDVCNGKRASPTRRVDRSLRGRALRGPEGPSWGGRAAAPVPALFMSRSLTQVKDFLRSAKDLRPISAVYLTTFGQGCRGGGVAEAATARGGEAIPIGLCPVRSRSEASPIVPVRPLAGGREVSRHRF